MSQVIVSSVGTSVLSKLLHPTEQQMLVDAASDNDLLRKPYVQTLLDRCHATIQMNPQLVMDSAELATLSLYARNVAKTEFLLPNTKYVFLVTDTAVGRVCGEIITQFVRFRYGAPADSYVIGGLQTQHIDALDTGFQQLEATLDKLRMQAGVVPPWHRLMSWLNASSSYQPRMVLNITGGFKVVSGWLQSYATIHGLHCMYTYEANRNTLIMLRTTNPNTMPRIEHYY